MYLVTDKISQPAMVIWAGFLKLWAIKFALREAIFELSNIQLWIQLIGYFFVARFETNNGMAQHCIDLHRR